MIPFEKSETILFNGKIVTLDSKETIATAVAIKKGRILSVEKIWRKSLGRPC